MTETLKPCPFCGGTDIDTHFSLDGAGNVTTGCMDCGASGPETATPDEEKGAEAWNRRALDAGSVREVVAEVGRAMNKFPTWPTDPLHAAAVVAEEAGELHKAALQHTYEPHKSSLADVREEAIQTAAMALRFLASMEVYVFKPCEQHTQAPLTAPPAIRSAFNETYDANARRRGQYEESRDD
jgi:Lar family restriction alleviation protein